MDKLDFYRYQTFNLPADVRADLENLPPEAREAFFQDYTSKQKNVGLAYVLHLLAGLAYAYEGKWWKQLLFWATFYGFGVWWVVQLFRIPTSIRKTNRSIARNIVRKIKVMLYSGTKRPIQGERSSQQGGRLQKSSFDKALQELSVKPRKITAQFDPANLTIENLKVGSLLDYDLQTWEVTRERQYDWDSGITERSFQLKADLEERSLQFYSENREKICYMNQSINIHAIDPDLQLTILSTRQPRNILQFQDTPYYKEYSLQGTLFGISPEETGKKAVRWEFLDDSRQKAIFIELIGEKEFRCWIGKRISEHDFSDILPGGEPH